jgi:signal transduction histidine kinase
MSWQIGAAANAVVTVAYLAIAWAIITPLVRTRQVRENRLGMATALLFLTCAGHHGAHSIHMILPTFGVEDEVGRAAREAWVWHVTAWDIVTAAMGIYYWSLRSTYGSLMRGAQLFEDLKEKQRQALEINDNIVQGLVTAKLALELHEQERSRDALEHSLTAARQIITDLLGEQGSETRLGPGDLVRSEPATWEPH